MTLNTLHDLYVEQLQDLYSAESQLIGALPRMARAATAPELQVGFELHCEQTKQQIKRLDALLADLGAQPGEHTCKAMQGLIAQGQDMIDKGAAPAVRDAGLIACAQRIEHYEIAGYGTLVRYAEVLSKSQHVETLRITETEEKKTDRQLTALSDTINAMAAQA